MTPDTPISSLRQRFNTNAFASYRNVIAIVAALTCLQAAQTSLAINVVLSLKQIGASNLILGLMGGAFSVGFLLGALRSPREIGRIGHIRAYVLFAAIGVIAAIGFMLTNKIVIWAAIQLMLGLSFAGLWAAGESWIAHAAPERQRGAILGFYQVVSKSGAVAGPFLIANTPEGMAFPLIAALFAASILPIASTSKSQPTLNAAEPIGPLQILRIAPAAAFAAFTAGMVNSAVAQLYPVYVAARDPVDAAFMSAQFNAALIIGAMIMVWPAGLLSDRIDRRLVISGASAIAAAAALVIVIFGAHMSQPAFLTAVCIYGAGALSFYAIGVAHAADRADPSQVTSMMAGILMIWSVGSISGPLTAGLVMSSPMGPSALFAFAAVMFCVLSLLMLRRKAAKAEAPPESKESFAAAPATSLAIATLDPRGHDDDQPDLFGDID